MGDDQKDVSGAYHTLPITETSNWCITNFHFFLQSNCNYQLPISDTIAQISKIFLFNFKFKRNLKINKALIKNN